MDVLQTTQRTAIDWNTFNNGSLTTPANPNHRALGGEGLGLRYTRGDWNMDVTLAWRSHGGKPVSDTRDDNPRLWATLARRF